MDGPTSHRRAVIGLIAGVLFAVLMWILPGTTQAASADPPGNNGTVKIDRLPFDNHPDNEPHVGCLFQVDWYGFDKGDLYLHVTFEVHPPTGQPAVLLEDKVFIGEDDNSGGGSEAGLDSSNTYDLTTALEGYAQQPQQGWHVKLTVDNDGSQGADVKHKVFWVTGCETPPPTTTTTTTVVPTTTTTTITPPPPPPPTTTTTVYTPPTTTTTIRRS